MVAEIYLARHGQTEWSLSGRHTSFTDLALTEEGKKEAEALAKRLQGIDFFAVFSSPLMRACQTADIIGLPYEKESNLVEWNYGEYEGLTRTQIQQEVEGWNVFDYPSPGGESSAQVEIRAQKLLARFKKSEGKILLISHGHFCRVLGSLWIGQHASFGKHLALSTASLSILSYERQCPVLHLWNGT